MIRLSQSVLYDDNDDDNDGGDDDDDMKIHTVQTRVNMDKPRRLRSDYNSKSNFYNELRYNS